MSDDARLTKAVRALVEEQAAAPEGETQADPSAIRRVQGNQIFVPQDMSYGDAIRILEAMQDQEGTAFMRRFNFRPYDGAFATQAVMLRDYGTIGVGVTTDMGMMGKIPPRRVSVAVGPNQHVQVPWGELMFPPFKARLTLDADYDDATGSLFLLTVQGPREKEREIEAFFDNIEGYLQTNSIYRGQAIDGQDTPDFLDLTGVDPGQVIYNDDTATQLNTNLWAPLSQVELFRELGLPMKRAVLLEGPYGTGKTLAAFLTAQRAVENEWTFIYCRPRDDFEGVMATARLYQPAVVFYEDIDRIADSDDPEDVTSLLDVFDGLKAKPADIVVVATTNHQDRIHKGMLRPGRLDAVIHIGDCDSAAAQDLIKAVIPDDLLTDVDFDTVGEALEGITPAFVREAANRAVRYAIIREGGRPTRLTTEDFIHASQELQTHRALMDKAHDDNRDKDTLTGILSRTVTDALHGTQVIHAPAGLALNTEDRVNIEDGEVKLRR